MSKIKFTAKNHEEFQAFLTYKQEFHAFLPTLKCFHILRDHSRAKILHIFPSFVVTLIIAVVLIRSVENDEKEEEILLEADAKKKSFEDFFSAGMRVKEKKYGKFPGLM